MKTKTKAAIAAVLCASALAAIWTSALSRAGDERRDAIARSLRANANLAIAFEEGAARTLTAAHGALRSVGQLRASREAIDQLVTERWAGEARPFVEIGVLDERGTLVAASGGARCLESLAQADFAARSATPDERLRIGNPVLCPSIGRWTVPVTLRIERDARFAGLAIATLEASALFGALDRAELGAGSVLAAVGEDGVARVRKTFDGSNSGGDYRGTPIDTARLRSPVGIAVGSGGPEAAVHYYAYRTLERFRLTVTVGTSEAEVLAAAARRRRDIYLWATLASILSALASIAVARAVGDLTTPRRATSPLDGAWGRA